MSLEHDIPDQDTINQNCPTCSGLPADDGHSQWVDAKEGDGPSDEELDRWFIERMEREESTSAKIGNYNMKIIDAITSLIA